MSVFPTQYSILQSAALNEHIAENYGLSDTKCKLLIHNVSDIYVLESTTEKYIFKIYRDMHRSLDQILGELEILNELKKAGASISYPLTDLSGKQVQQFEAAEGIRNGVLFSYAAGKVILDMNTKQLKTAGREIALIHQHTSTIKLNHFRPEYNNYTTLIGPLTTLAPHFKEMPDEFAWLTATAEKVIAKLSSFDTSSFSVGYCHYDFLPKNFHFDEADKVTFFDFDFAGKGYLVNDLMTLFVHFFLDSEFKRCSPEKAKQDFNTIVEAYREVKHLSDEELAAIPYLGFQFWIFYMEFHYENFDDWSNIFLTQKYTKDRVALIKRWMERYAIN